MIVTLILDEGNRRTQLERLKKELLIAEQQEAQGEVFQYENGNQVLSDIKRTGRDLLKRRTESSGP